MERFPYPIAPRHISRDIKRVPTTSAIGALSFFLYAATLSVFVGAETVLYVTVTDALVCAAVRNSLTLSSSMAKPIFSMFVLTYLLFTTPTSPP